VSIEIIAREVKNSADDCVIHRGDSSKACVLVANGAAMDQTDNSAGKHVRSCIVYTWDHKSSLSFWAGMKVYEFAQTSSSTSSRSKPFTADSTRAYYDWNRNRQPVMADEVQTFKALITIHKVLQEGHPITVKEAQQNVNWIESLARGVNGEGLRGMVVQGLEMGALMWMWLDGCDLKEFRPGLGVSRNMDAADVG